MEQIFRKIRQSIAANQFDELTKAATSLDNYAKELEALEIKDEQLQGFKTRFIKMYKDTGQSSRDLVAAAKKQDRAGVEKSLKDLQAATSQESSLVDEVNKYCRGK